MSVKPIQDRDQTVPQPQGHVVGFADSREMCDTIVDALEQSGFEESKLTVFAGDDGIHLLKRMMEGLWGESAQKFLQRAVEELEKGHSAICVEVRNLPEAREAALLAGRFGGHSFDHFGVFVDTQLTA
jgi:hypothetical protein